MRHADVPPDDWLRNALYKKIRTSWPEGDERKTYQYLLDCMERKSARLRDDKNMAARDKYAREFATSGRSTAPAPDAGNLKAAAPAPKGNPKAKADPKPKAAPKPKATPVLPSPQLKQHGKGKGKKSKPRAGCCTRSETHRNFRTYTCDCGKGRRCD